MAVLSAANPEIQARLPVSRGQSHIGNIDRHKQEQEACAAHGRDRLQGHKIGDDEGERSGYQGTFKMLAAQSTVRAL